MPKPERPAHIEESIKYLAKQLCVINGIPPTDVDGSANWFMFYGEVAPVIDSLVKRGLDCEGMKRAMGLADEDQNKNAHIRTGETEAEPSPIEETKKED